MTKGNPPDETGKRYGRLTVIERDIQRPIGRAFWHCLCDCGNKISILGSSLRSGNTKSCGCYHSEVSRAQWLLPNGISAKNRAILNMKRNAKRRNIEWKLTDDQVLDIVKCDCHYCGQSPSNVQKGHLDGGDFIYNGLDRINSDKDYTIDNVVSCCFICNNAKRTMPLSEFLEWIERVYSHSIQKRQR